MLEVTKGSSVKSIACRAKFLTGDHPVRAQTKSQERCGSKSGGEQRGAKQWDAVPGMTLIKKG